MASSSQVRHLWLRGFRDLLKERGQEERGRDAESPSELPADPVPRQPRALGRCEEERSFHRQRPPVARCALPRVWDSPQDPGRGPGKLWTERCSERRTLGREEGRTAVLPARPHVPVPPPRRWRRQPVRFSTAQSSGTVPDAQGLQGPRESVSCCLRSFARV